MTEFPDVLSDFLKQLMDLKLIGNYIVVGPDFDIEIYKKINETDTLLKIKKKK